MKKIMVGCNILTSIDGICYPNHCQNWYQWGKTLSNDYEFHFVSPRRLSIDNMRNLTAKIALQRECDYLMFYDDDIVFPVDALKKLIERDKDIIAGVTYIRGYPFEPMIMKYIPYRYQENTVAMDHYRDFMDDADESGLVECDAVGFSLVLIKTSIIKNLTPPWFITGPKNTEDIYFCIRAAKELGTKIYVDTTIHTNHLVDKFYVNHKNRKGLKEFLNLIDENHVSDRTDNYLKEAKELIG